MPSEPARGTAELTSAQMQDPDRRTPGEAMIAGIDHLVLTVRSLDETCAFYARVLGFRRIDAPGRPTALAFADQKINIHEVGHTFEPKALAPTAGAGDFCLVCSWSMAKLAAHLERQKVDVELGPVTRDGARGKMTSVYFRDPDGNLVEVACYDRLEKSYPAPGGGAGYP